MGGVNDWERLGITPDGQIALEELLGGVERNLLVASVTSIRGPLGLTRREAEVLSYVAEGPTRRSEPG